MVDANLNQVGKPKMCLGRLITVAGALVAATAMTAMFASAQDSALACGSFDLVGTDKTTDILDHPPEGDSAGDVRVGYRALEDGDGNSVGELFFVSTMLRPGEQDDHLFAGDFRILLPDGLVVGTATYQRPNVVDQSTPALTMIVSGGSGAYEGASGRVEIGTGETPDYAFRLACD